MRESADGRWQRGILLLVGTMILSLVLSVGGIVYAVYWGVSADGGRGGAVAVALTFLMLFIGPDTAQKVLDGDLPVTGNPKRDAELVVARVRNSLSALLDWAGKEKLYLSISSVSGTLVWGFGDLVASWLGAPSS